MNWLVYHVASGQSFFSGLLLIVIAVLTSASRQRRFARVSTVLAILGAVAVALSSTAIPYAAYAVLGAALAAWIAARIADQYRTPAAFLVVAVVLVCGALEAPYHWLPALSPVGPRSLAVIGDSVTAGLGENGEVTWPAILTETHKVRVHDLSHVGETAASALKRARLQEIDSPIVLVEIGGNDILGATTVKQFDVDLNALLSHLGASGRQVIMFELPLPPFYHEFGRIQRAAARRHKVALIPKRIFLGLLAGNDATLDSIHLSQAGHDQMAELVWRLVGPTFGSANSSPNTPPPQDQSRL